MQYENCPVRRGDVYCGDQRDIKLYENAEEAMGQDYQAVASVSAIAR